MADRPVMRRQPPQIAQVASISSIMMDVIVALIPALGVATYLFGLRVLALTAVSVAACVAAEYVCCRLRKVENTVGDLSACVTGLLLAMSLPVTAPYWAPVLGGVFGIVVVKQFYGGLGRNFLNPALAGRMLLATFPGFMTTWVDAFQRPGLLSTADAVTSATPMAYLHQGELPGLTVGQMLMGQHGGAMGAGAVLMLMLGGLYLLARRVISPRAPLAYLGTVALLTLLFPRGDGGAVAWMLAQLFSGGLIPSYILMVSYLGLRDNILAMILPGLISAWSIFLMRNFMKAIPDSLYESATIDGAGDFRIYWQIFLPLAIPSLATVGLFLALGYWNEWYNAMLYIQTPSKYPLQYFLQKMVNQTNVQLLISQGVQIDVSDLPTQSIKMATAVVATGPVILFYPFVQRYFVSGLTVGAVKG